MVFILKFYFQLQTNTLNPLKNLFSTLHNFNIFQRYKVDKYLHCGGPAIHSDYIRKSIPIETEFLTCKEKVSKKFGITLISEMFITVKSNILADKHHYKVDNGIRSVYRTEFTELFSLILELISSIFSFNDITNKLPGIKLSRSECNGITLRSKTFKSNPSSRAQNPEFTSNPRTPLLLP